LIFIDNLSKEKSFNESAENEDDASDEYNDEDEDFERLSQIS